MEGKISGGIFFGKGDDAVGADFWDGAGEGQLLLLRVKFGVTLPKGGSEKTVPGVEDKIPAPAGIGFRKIGENGFIGFRIFGKTGKQL